MEDSIAPRPNAATRYGLIAIALIQGWLLYFLHISLDNHVWPATDLRWLVSFYAVVIAVPVFFYFGMERLRDWRNFIALCLLVPLCFWLGWHHGWLIQEPALQGASAVGYSFLFFVSVGVALFILTLFFRTWSFNLAVRFRYNQLLEYSWQNSLTLCLLGLFVLVFWLLLILWGLLFDVIGISFFTKLFRQPVFIYPVTALVGGWGLVLIRERIKLIATTRAMCETLIKALLPLAILIAILFLAALPFTGLQKIWDTGKAAVLMMSLTTVILFFFNSALSDNPEHPPYPHWLRNYVLFGIALLPINSILAAWALALRIEQYGLTVDRLWACVLQLLIAAFTLSYAILFLLKRSNRFSASQTANKWLAFVVATVLLVINTPVADLRSWAATSQADRLLSGDVDPKAFDYKYLRFQLGAYGVMELKRLQETEFVANHPAVAQQIGAVLKQKNRWVETPVVDTTDEAAVASMVAVLPADATIPPALLTRFMKNRSSCLAEALRCQLVRVRANSDRYFWWGINRRHGGYLSGVVYDLYDNKWLRIGTLASRGCLDDAQPELGANDIIQPVAASRFVFSDGKCFYQITPNVPYLNRLGQQQ